MAGGKLPLRQPITNRVEAICPQGEGFYFWGQMDAYLADGGRLLGTI